VAQRPTGLHRVGCTHRLQAVAGRRNQSDEVPRASVMAAR
jgi:hypothetical protein